MYVSQAEVSMRYRRAHTVDAPGDAPRAAEVLDGFGHLDAWYVHLGGHAQLPREAVR